MHGVVDSLAVSDGTLEERLFRAYVDLEAITPDDDLPVELRDVFTQIMKPLDDADVALGESRVRVAVSRMTGHERTAMALRILTLYSELAELLGT